jgi:hypothetical protein
MRALRSLIVAAIAACLAGECETTGVLAGQTVSSAQGAGAASGAAPASPADAGAARAGATFPNADGSLRFGVLGDFGTGDSGQYALAARMAALHTTFPFELVTLVGDNLYGSERPQDFRTKFETPYKALLDRGVKFYASLGNHDAREQRFYKLFNMGGELYYSFKAPKQSVRFFALESTYLEPGQVKWLEAALASSTDDWKIAYFHHPLYSSGGRHGSDEQIRQVLEPLFIKHGVSVVLNGHDHHYERTRPQNGITYFVTGSGGKLRADDYRPNLPFSEKVVANTLVFLAVEISGDVMTYKAISREGTVVDSGEITRRRMP